MSDIEFYSRLNTLVEEAAKGGLTMPVIVEDLRLLANVLSALHVTKSVVQL